MTKVSVIIPVYGVEKYIERCARSLFEQTLDDIEFIFVNDCTPDRSICILKTTLDEYPNRKHQVRIINQARNLGAAQARKDGIFAAAGEYVIQCDSDDWVAPNMYSDMLKQAETTGSDLVMCKKIYMSDGEHYTTITDTIVENKEQMMSLIISGKTSVSVWSRLVKKQLFLDKRFIFPPSHMKEDTVISVQLTYLSKKATCVEGPYYYYFSNPNSICLSITEEACVKRWSESKRNTDVLIKFLEQEKMLNLYSSELKLLKFQVKGFLLPLLKKNLKYWKEWKQTYSEINISILFNKKISFGLRIVHLLTLLRVYHLKK